MAEKKISKHLSILEKQFASSDPVLLKAVKVFHELDQLEFDMGLLDEDETTARKTSWWPIVSTLGGHTPAKNEFISRYLGAELHASQHKFTVFQFSPKDTASILPGTALDADHRLPFYQISHVMNQASEGEGGKINAYLELVPVNSETLRGRLLVDTPVLNSARINPVNTLLTQHVIDMSDLVLVFTDLFDAEAELTQKTIDTIREKQDSNKFIFVIDHSEISLEARKIHEITKSWQRRLTDLGIITGQFVVLSENGDTSVIDRRFRNLDNDRTYRVLNTLEKSIRNVDELLIPEVKNAITTWKDRSNSSILIVLGFIVTLILFAEISIGVTDFLFDPIIGPLVLLFFIVTLTPLHLIVSRVHARFLINSLHDRQRKLNITENLSGMFEKSLTFWRIMLPIKEPAAKNKKTRTKLTRLIEQCKDLVQSLNDQFSDYQHGGVSRMGGGNELADFDQ